MREVTVLVLEDKEGWTRNHPEYVPTVAVYPGHLVDTMALTLWIRDANAELVKTHDPVADVENGPSAEDVPHQWTIPTALEAMNVHVSYHWIQF